MSVYACKKHHLHERLSNHLLHENVNRIKLFALIPVVGVLLLMVSAVAHPYFSRGYPPWLTLAFGFGMLLLSSVLQIMRNHIGAIAQTIVLNATHVAILAFSVALYFCKGDFQKYSLTIYIIGILFCAITIVRRPIVMIAGYVLALASLLGYSFHIYNALPVDIHVFFLFLVTAIACMSAVVRFKRSLVVFSEQEKVEMLNHQLEITSSTDKLTGLANRMKTDEEFHKLLLFAQENKSPLSVILLDIDNFKQINDTYGHQTGDRVMRTVAETIRQNTRQKDFVGRWGGDEFLVICPQMELRQSVMLAERIKEAVSAATLPFGFRTTISGGIGQISSQETESGLFSRVDEALYSAKTGGRNRLEVSFGDRACLQPV